MMPFHAFKALITMASQLCLLGNIGYGRVKGNSRHDPYNLPKFPRIHSATELFHRPRQDPDTSLNHQLLHPKPRVITLALLLGRSPRGNKLPPVIHP
jgi:hypothetical protein